MEFEDTCRVKGCNKQASKLGTNEIGAIIEMCDDCWYKKYRS